MIRKMILPALLALAALVAAPALADKVIVQLQHTDAMTIMGQTTPAEDTTQEFWFGDSAMRFDDDDITIINRLDKKKLYFVNNAEKTYSAIDLPIDFNKLVGPEMAPMMEQMAAMMGGSAKVTPTDKAGSFAGFDCKFSRADVDMSMMKMTMDMCLSEKLPVDYRRYQSMVESRAELLPSTKWMKELAKLQGFPVRSDSTTTVMGKSFKSYQELVSSEEKAAPAGTYEPPAGYTEKAFDPMGQGAAKRRK